MTDIIAAHKFSSNHRESILKSKVCGCFYCLEVFKPNEIVYWIDNDHTALCPKCRIDSVIADADLKIDRQFLEEMQKHWF